MTAADRPARSSWRQAVGGLGRARRWLAGVKLEATIVALLLATFAAIHYQHALLDRTQIYSAANGTAYNAYFYGDQGAGGTSTVTPDAGQPLSWTCDLRPTYQYPFCGYGLLFDRLTPATIDVFVDAATGEAGSALLSAEIRQLGGAVARSAPGHGALSSIAAPFAGFAVGAAPTRELQELVVHQVTNWKTALEPWTAEYDYLNFAERPRDPSRMYAGGYTLRRLQAVKAAYDPADRIQANHPIRPTAR